MSGETITESGSLLLGVKVGEVLHRSFVLRAPTVQDNIDAAQEVGVSSALHVNAAIYARQLVSLGTLTRRPAKAPELKAGDVVPTYIDTDLICDMHPMDFNQLEAAAMRLEKKLLLAAGLSDGGSASASPSASTASSPSTS